MHTTTPAANGFAIHVESPDATLEYGLFVRCDLQNYTEFTIGATPPLVDVASSRTPDDSGEHLSIITRETQQ
jgi:hypothetical protein